MSDTISNAQVRPEGDRVIFIIDGKGYSLPPEAAIMIGRLLLSAAHKAEEYAKAENVILDTAIFLRSGAPFLLSSNPKIIEEAKKEALYNRDLRRAMPLSIGSTSVVASPLVTQSPPPEKKP